MAICIVIYCVYAFNWFMRFLAKIDAMVFSRTGLGQSKETVINIMWESHQKSEVVAFQYITEINIVLEIVLK